ncbi:Uncharacterized protein HSRCO_1081 [Halanaeroarchaeum sp. HSR-CO]|uniref:DUF7513 family protein n=1 Tax=Halanaeroarchaeum sp. HSR-CO TaxID=2866382 RepID=UPI00217ECD50|nr:hypothetical protein [Halanaeroarchaeum sp. HSR-CO]UWG47369.1 Uncharacterized protein HSRCO_1081 [Halanaeroarchaeum sp. HSR-CO]
MTNPFFAGFSFRTKTPSFDVGDELELFVTGQSDEGFVARVGDTILHVEGAPSGSVDTRIRARVTDFDTESHQGTVEFIEKIGESSF